MRHRTGWLLAVLFCALSGANAQTSIGDTIALDKRLEKKVTVEVVHVKLADVADQLTKQTGVTIKAGTSAKDWKPRERKVTIFAKDIPAGELLKEIAGLLDFELTASGKEGAWEYRFWLDRKSRQAEDEAVAAAEKADKERDTESYQAVLDQADEALGMTPSEALAKRTSSPWLAFLGCTDTGRAYARILSYLNKQGVEFRSRFLAGKIIEMEVAGLPADIQQAILQAANGTLARYGQGESEDPAEVTNVTIQPSGGGDARFVAGEMSFGCMMGGSSQDDPLYQEGIASLPIVPPDSPIGKLLGEFAIRVESGSDPESLEQEFEGLLGKDGDLVRDYFNHDSPTRDNPPTDPELTREIEIRKVDEEPRDPMETECDPELIGAHVREISRATGWPVLIESFDWLNNFPALITTGKQPLYKLLIALEETGYAWKREHNTLCIWPEDRLAKRAPEISEALVARYERLWETQGVLSLDDHAALVSSLTDNQIMHGLDNTRLSGLFDPQITYKAPGIREMLRLYGSLSRMQKALLFSEAGLPFAQLGGQQWQRIRTMLARELPEAEVAGGAIKLILNDSYPSVSIVVVGQGIEERQTVSYQFCIPSRTPDDPPQEEQQ